MKSRIFKFTLFILLPMAVLLGITTAGLHSARFKNWLKDKLIQGANNALNGQVHIGRLSGGLFATWKAEHLSLTSGTDTLATIESARMRLNPFGLLNRTVSILYLDIQEPRVYLRQWPDSLWNVSRLFTDSDPSDSTSSGWHTEFKDIRLHAGIVFIRWASPAVNLPKKVKDIDLHLSAEFINDLSMGRLQECRFIIEDLDFQVRNLKGSFTVRRDSVWIDDVYLLTRHSSLNGQLTFPFDASTYYRFSLMADSLDDREVRVFVPEWPVNQPVQLTMDGMADGDSLHWQMTARRAGESLQSTGRFLWQDQKDRLRLQAGFQHLFSGTWIDAAPIPFELSGDLFLSGWGFEPATAAWSAVGNLHDCRIADIDLQEGTLWFEILSDTVEAEIDGRGPWGQLRAQGLMHTLGGQPQYRVNLTTWRLNLGKLLEQDSLSSDLSLHLAVSGKGLTEADVDAQFTLQADSSEAAGYQIEELQAVGIIRQGAIILDSLSITSPAGHLFCQGTRQASGWLDVVYHGDLHDSDFVRKWLQEDSLQLAGNFYGRLTGYIDSLETVGGMNLLQSQYGSFTADALQATWRINGPLSRPTGRANARFRGVRFNSSLKADSANLTFQSMDSQQTLDARLFFPNSVSAQTLLQLQITDSTLQCAVSSAEIKFRQQIWRGGGDSSIIRISPQGITFNQISLSSDDQRIQLEGALPQTGEIDLSLILKNIDVQTWGRLYSDRWPLSGRLDWYSHIGGYTSAPTLESNLDLQSGQFGSFVFDSLALNVGYREDVSQWRMHLFKRNESPLILLATVPVHVSFDETEPIVFPDRTVQANLEIKDLSLQILSTLIPEIDFEGNINGQLQINNTLKNMNPSGNLTLQDGRIDHPVLGKPLRDVAAKVQFDSTRITLSRLYLRGGEGTVLGTGYLNYNRSDWKNPVKSYLLQLRAERFTPIDSREMTMTLQGDLSVEKTSRTPQMTGKLSVIRSRFDLTAIAAQPSTLWLADRPLLIVTQQDTFNQAYDASILTPAWLRMLEPIRGKIKLEIPRNTWLRGREMNIEIAGELDLIKEGRPFELFGAIRILRGSYDLYGRRFEIETGALTFLGGDEFNPNIDLEAENIFRGIDRQKRTLKLYLSGQVYRPTLRFSLDGLEIAETDAVSYLLFGRSFDQLTQGEKSDLAQSQGQSVMSGDAMKQLLAGQIAGQLTNSLRNQLNLDVIEFRGDQNWRQATIVVGKYITNDLFVSYSREFNFSRTNEVVPEQVTLEYEFFHSLHIQATKGDEKTSGLDVIWKWEK